MGILDTFKRKKTDDGQAAAAVKPAKKAAVKKAAKPAAKAAVKPKATATKAAAGDSKTLSVSNVLIQPAYTEKSFRLQQMNKYVFFVAMDANKHQVRMAVKQTYGHEPSAVHMVRIKPQTLYRWGRATGTIKGIKKAIVTMPAGTTLPVTK